MENKKGLGLGSILCGFVGLFILGLPLGITAIILGASSFEETTGKIGLALGIFNVIALLLFLL